MRKAINFDIDTKKYEECTSKLAPTAYKYIRNFMQKNGFEHRQGSGYVSKDNLSTSDVVFLSNKMSLTFPWLKYCIKKIDVTNIGKQYSLIDTISKSSDKHSDINDIEL